MFNLNPNHLKTVREADEFLGALPKCFDFWDDTSPQLRKAYQTFLRAIRQEVRFLKKHVLRYELHQPFEGESIPAELLNTIRFHTQNASTYFVWRCCDGAIRSDSKHPEHFETLWTISRNPDQCVKQWNERSTTFRLQHARNPEDSSLNF